ncbi:hypothetical protein ACWEFJ_27465 [Actinosynnema sp. NPDC004786]
MLGRIALVVVGTLVSGLLTAPAGEADDTAAKRPVYAIAHGVNSPAALHRAVAAGANGVEIDICANWERRDRPAWYFDHDCKGSTRERAVARMFEEIVALDPATRPLLVWLDIKTPDKCRKAEAPCSTRGLARQAKTLTNAGVQVLYDLTSKDYDKNKETLRGPGYRNLAPDISAKDENGVPLEGVGFWGDTEHALAAFRKANVPPGQRVLEVGDCGSIYREEVKGDVETGAAERDKPNPGLAAVLVWTMYAKGYPECDEVLGPIDGIIAGNHDFGKNAEDAATLRWVTEGSGNELARPGHRLFRE